jgi:uncharacterized protein
LKKKVALVTIVFGLLTIIIFFDKLAAVLINIQWYREVGYLQVYFTRLSATIKLMVPIFFIFFICTFIYYRSIRKTAAKSNSLSSTERKIFIFINILISLLLSCFIAFTYWDRILLFTNSTYFNVKDPIFKIDISFYMFRLPLIQSVFNSILSFLIVLVLITVVVFLISNVKEKLFSRGAKGPFLSMRNMSSGLGKFAGKQLAVICSLLLLMVSFGYILKSFYLLYSERGVVFGASYTDIRVTLKFYIVIIILSFISAFIVFIGIMMSKIKTVIIPIVVIVILVLLEGIFASTAQTYVVDINQISMEEPYIRNNITATRHAFKLDRIEEQSYSIDNNLTMDIIDKNKSIIDNIKINSYKPALDFYNQVQFIRYYYGFGDVDIDRYNINGRMTQVFISPREVITKAIEPNNWQNRHLVYTHGYGVVMSKVNSVTADGQPDFIMKNMPVENETDLELSNPRIYFGEKTDYYAIVNTKEGEVDYPQGSSNATYKYDGSAGIKMRLLNRILFAVHERNSELLLSSDIRSESRILYNRNIIQRVKKIAPFLTYDSDPYIVICDGRLKWIIDAYTVSDKYPYGQPYGDINYMRNSVKVVVDAYNGSCDFYIVDEEDPIIKTYSSIFKGLFKNSHSIPQNIREHFRYPKDIFNLQCDILGRYHSEDPRVFLTGENIWQISGNTKGIEGDKILNEPLYVFTRLPEEEKEEMVLLEYFNYRDSENMSAMAAARMDGSNYGRLMIYKFPHNKTVYSPYLFHKKFNQDPDIAQYLSLWEGKGSRVYYGDTVIVPISESLLYIEPIYLIAEGKNNIPEMRRIIVGYDDKLVVAENIDRALQMLFTEEDIPVEPVTPDVIDETHELIKMAKEYYDMAVEAQRNLDWDSYGEYITKLGEVLEELSK